MSFVEFEAMDGSPVSVNTDQVHWAQTLPQMIGFVGLCMLPDAKGSHVFLIVKGTTREVFDKMKRPKGLPMAGMVSDGTGLVGRSH